MATAAISSPRILSETDEALFDTVFDINVKGAFFTVKLAFRLSGEGSSMILAV
jgi:NAD(P)-dependent dehydrogenase (short-subunit alcohol dehydrogenase family)